ncbi:MAG: tetratricopeptide repeat protein [Planctomycetota bacterium]|nr:tetratricopeptide repeat protein [Planctomycetota bacterium]
MIRYFLLLLALGPMVMNGADAAAPASAARAASPGDPYYCPPGAKFCPVPGRDNTLFLDTHFGMDAATGEIKAYQGTVHPDETADNLTLREETLYRSPPISVENRQVPWPDAETYAAYPAPPPQTPASSFRTPARSAVQPVPQPRGRQFVQTSEVANRQTSRPSAPVATAPSEPESKNGIPWWKGGWWRKDDTAARSRDPSPAYPGQSPEAAFRQSSGAGAEPWNDAAEDRRIPWWKGGWWRNRGDRDEDDSPPPPPRRPEPRRGGGGDAPPPVTPDDMWDDDGYGDYNSDFSSPDVSWQTQQPQPQYRQQPGGYAEDPYAQPYPGGYASEPYTLPNSPPPSSPYQPGYVYPGSAVTYDNTYQAGYPNSQPPPQTYNDPFAAPAPTFGDPYASSPSGYQAPASFMPPPPAPGYADPGAPGSPQFDNAVRLVKESRFSEAKPLLSAETSSNPRNAAAWRWLGDCHYNLLELPQALDAYQRAIQLDPNDYYAIRGQGFANLHRGHELWRNMMEELNLGQREQAAATFAQAHDNYKKSLELLSDCLRRAPNDGEAIYGEAMAAEGASRKLYSNAVSYIKLGPENRERAELFAENCLQVINKGVERATERAKQNPGEIGPRALLGGLHLRKAMLYHQLGKRDLALGEIVNSYQAQKAILDEIDKNNATALKGVQDCQTYWSEWGGAGELG